MNRKLFILPLSMCSIFASGQDRIFRHSGDAFTCNVMSVQENSIVFTYPGETVTNSIGKPAVDKVEFEGGRIQKISDRISTEGPDGWEHVIITSNPDDVAGLRRIGEVDGVTTGTWNLKSSKGLQRKSMARIKRDAVKKGGHIVLVISKETERRRAYNPGISSVSGIAYGY